ncbi:hypothetical protein LH51_05950 [Nitrincola sp. A-D6]|uniref:hypothetical protein n=1 Tax=Nitrincola sp. A-D6 TaxID=1545442 RepID=UPI00051F9DEA|nr:hypothetical protein [Nitrincola sp. A-D6]KGK42596.1 hypothetical protein LH51_05950 [Nitrincola sp. A-D6]
MSPDQEKRLESAGLASGSGRDKQRKRFAAVCFRVLLLQLALTSVLALALMFKDFVTAYSAFIGGFYIFSQQVGFHSEY